MNEILAILKERFECNIHRHANVKWDEIVTLLECKPDKLKILEKMEKTSGEPDLVVLPNGEYAYFDFTPDCTKDRKSLCYDKAAWDSRKTNKPVGSVEEAVKEIGSLLLGEEDYFFLQSIEEVDLKCSCWLKTPEEIRRKNGGIFGDRRFGRTFIFHNGPESYYSSRGFRTKILL